MTIFRLLEILLLIFVKQPLMVIGIVAATTAIVVPPYFYLNRLDQTGREQTANRIRKGLKIFGLLLITAILTLSFFFVKGYIAEMNTIIH